MVVPFVGAEIGVPALTSTAPKIGRAETPVRAERRPETARIHTSVEHGQALSRSIQR
jgi:hypothetical protein